MRVKTLDSKLKPVLRLTMIIDAQMHLTSAMGAAASRGTHVTRKGEFIFEFELEKVTSF